MCADAGGAAHPADTRRRTANTTNERSKKVRTTERCLQTKQAIYAPLTLRCLTTKYTYVMFSRVKEHEEVLNFYIQKWSTFSALKELVTIINNNIVNNKNNFTVAAHVTNSRL